MTQAEIDAMLNLTKESSENPELTNELGLQELTEKEVTAVASTDKELSSSTIYSQLDPKLELLYDLQLAVSIELGRTNMLIRDILKLGRGSVIEFDKLVSEPVDLFVNGKKIAEGEVVVIDKHFGIRLTTLIDPTERLKTIKK